MRKRISSTLKHNEGTFRLSANRINFFPAHQSAYIVLKTHKAATAATTTVTVKTRKDQQRIQPQAAEMDIRLCRNSGDMNGLFIHSSF